MRGFRYSSMYMLWRADRRGGRVQNPANTEGAGTDATSPVASHPYAVALFTGLTGEWSLNTSHLFVAQEVSSCPAALI